MTGIRNIRERLQELLRDVARIESEEKLSQSQRILAPADTIMERTFTGTFRGRQRDLMNLPDDPDFDDSDDSEAA